MVPNFTVCKAFARLMISESLSVTLSYSEMHFRSYSHCLASYTVITNGGEGGAEAGVMSLADVSKDALCCFTFVSLEISTETPYLLLTVGNIRRPYSASCRFLQLLLVTDVVFLA